MAPERPYETTVQVFTERQKIDLSESQDRAFRESHHRLITRERLREPLIITLFHAGDDPHKSPHSYTYAATVDAEFNPSVRELLADPGTQFPTSPLQALITEFIEGLRAEQQRENPQAPPAWIQGFVLFDRTSGLLEMSLYVNEHADRVRTMQGRQIVEDATSAYAIFNRESSQPVPPEPLAGPMAQFAGSWKLTGMQKGRFFTEDDPEFEDVVREWLPAYHTQLPTDIWTPVRGLALGIDEHSGTVRQRPLRPAPEVPIWTSLTGGFVTQPESFDATLDCRGHFRVEDDARAMWRSLSGYGFSDFRTSEHFWRTESGELIRATRSFDPSGRSLNETWSRYERDESPDVLAALEASAPEVDRPRVPVIEGEWELESWVSEPDLVQFRDEAWKKRARFWAIMSETEIPSRGWQRSAVTRLTILPDHSFHERIVTDGNLPWWDEAVTLNNTPAPFSGQLLDMYGSMFLMPKGYAQEHERFRSDTSSAINHLFLRYDGTLIRAQSVSFEDNYMFHRVWLKYRRVGDKGQ